MIEFEDFEAFEDCGLTIDDLGISPAPLPALPPAWMTPRWWHPCETLEDHARTTIERYARPTLDRLNASPGDPVFDHRGERVSLNDLLAPFGFDAVNDRKTFD